MTGRPPQDYAKFIGQRSGMIEIIEEGAMNKHSIKMMIARCDCGNRIKVRLGDFKKGRYVSCGCNRGANRRTHGGKGTRLYDLWCGIKGRCECESNTGYAMYGAKGITVCDEWRDDFNTFKRWAVANGYNETLSIDRIDFNGNYEPGNCRWANDKVQANNTSRNARVEYQGKSFTIAELSDIAAVDYHALHSRIFKLGWSIEKAVNQPLRGQKK